VRLQGGALLVEEGTAGDQVEDPLVRRAVDGPSISYDRTGG
jgi:hypothetical protein